MGITKYVGKVGNAMLERVIYHHPKNDE